MQTARLGLLTALLVAALATPAAQAQKATDAFGKWRHPDNGSIVRMYSCGAKKLCAKIVSIKDGQKRDNKNPNKKLRNRPIIGLVIMRGARPKGKKAWQGNLYNRADGAMYAGTVTVVDRKRLKLSGCSRVVSFICKTVTWSRVGK